VKTYGGWEWKYSSTIIDLGTRCELLALRFLGPIPGERVPLPLYPLHTRRGGYREIEIHFDPLQEIQPKPFNFASRRYTDRAIPVRNRFWCKSEKLRYIKAIWEYLMLLVGFYLGPQRNIHLRSRTETAVSVEDSDAPSLDPEDRRMRSLSGPEDSAECCVKLTASGSAIRRGRVCWKMLSAERREPPPRHKTSVEYLSFFYVVSVCVCVSGEQRGFILAHIQPPALTVHTPGWTRAQR
jgi:hypothetical protein